MRFKALTEEEIKRSSFLKDGLYDYEVIHSEEGIGQKSGNEYVTLKLKIWDEEGREHPLFTNLAFIKLLKHFCDVNDLIEEYKSGNIPAEKCMNKCGGKVLIGFEDEKPNPKGGMYKAKNVVKDYVKEHKISQAMPLIKEGESFNDDLPF